MESTLCARTGAGGSPLADTSESDDAYLVEVELPGVRRDDVAIDLVGDELVITGEFKERERTGLVRTHIRPTRGVRVPRHVADAETSPQSRPRVCSRSGCRRPSGQASANRHHRRLTARYPPQRVTGSGIGHLGSRSVGKHHLSVCTAVLSAERGAPAR